MITNELVQPSEFTEKLFINSGLEVLIFTISFIGVQGLKEHPVLRVRSMEQTKILPVDLSLTDIRKVVDFVGSFLSVDPSLQDLKFSKKVFFLACFTFSILLIPRRTS